MQKRHPTTGVALLVAAFLATLPPARAGEQLGDVIRTASPSIVRVEAEQVAVQPSVSARASASGLVWDEKGHVVTIKSVVDRAKKIRVVTTKGNSHDATLLATDPGTGLALLLVTGLNVPALRLAKEAQLGQRVVAAGYAYGTYRPFFSDGIISDTRARLPGFAASCLQSDTATPPGTGGGPVLSTRARVLGLNLASGGTRPGSLVSYAVPIQEVRRVVQSLLRGETPRRGTLGIRLKVRNGRVAVLDLSKDSPAKRAGIRKDDMIVSIQGAPVTSEDHLVQIVRGTAPGETLSLTVERSGKQKTCAVTVAQWQAPAAPPQPFHLPPGGKFEVTPIGPAASASEPQVLTAPPITLTDPLLQPPAAGADTIVINGSIEMPEITFRNTAYPSIEAFTAAIKATPPRSVTLTAEASLPFKLVHDVMATLHENGVTRVSIAVKKE